MTIHHIPERLTQALEKLKQLGQKNLYFAPIRHHSPACSVALMNYIHSIKPTHILIEAPHTFNPLIDDLLNSHTKPPVALFAQAQLKTKPNKSDDDEKPIPNVHSAFFPFCEYSPEWVALNEGKKVGSHCYFIDLDWASQSQLKDDLDGNDKDNKNLMQERYLAHSTYINTLAKKLHCRDHDELWEQLFEIKPPNQLLTPSQFFEECFVWCSLARLDYEDEVLYQEGSLHREYCMVQNILPHLTNNHKVLIVTGGFHTLALIEQLSDYFNHQPIKPYLIKSNYQEDAWLIRYSFDRLNALNGYASGMPSPAYYQTYWHHLLEQQHQYQNGNTNQENTNTQSHFVNYVSLLCHHLDTKQALDITPFIAIKNTLEIALGLSLLRGHYYPSRYDLLDGIQTALIKGELDDGKAYLWQVVYDYLSGNQLGEVAKSQKSPALLQNTYQKVVAFKFKTDDTLIKTRKLDIYRKPIHRQISQFLHLLYFLNIGFARFLSGADFISGHNLDLLFEEWEYAWTPSVEAHLIELSEQGDDLITLASHQLLDQKQQLQKEGITPSASDIATLFAQACKMGLNTQMALLSQELAYYLDNDDNLSSLIGATEQLFYLWQGRSLLNLNPDSLKNQLLLGIRQSCYHLDAIYDTTPEQIENNLNSLISLNKLIKNIGIEFGLSDEYLDLFYQKLSHKTLIKLGLFSHAGALQTLSYLDNKICQKTLQNTIKNAFATGTMPEDSIAYLQGIFKVSPEYFTNSSFAIDTLYELIVSWDNALFLSILPDLRFIFSTLTPRQSNDIAKQIAKKTLSNDEISIAMVDLSMSESQMLYGANLNEKIRILLNNDQLNYHQIDEEKIDGSIQ